MADRNPIVTIPKYVKAGVLGSGKYAINELLYAAAARAQRAYDERVAVENINSLASQAQASSVGDTAEEIAAFEAGYTVHHKRLVRDYRVLLTSPDPSPESMRNAALQAVIDNFAARDPDSDGLITRQAAGFHTELFTALDIDADGKISIANLQAGIAP